MATISYFDIWQTYEHETITDEDLLEFAKGLFKEGFIRVSTVYDEELDKNVTRYDINASKTIKDKPKKSPEVDTKPRESIPDSKDDNWFLKLFKGDEKKID